MQQIPLKRAETSQFSKHNKISFKVLRMRCIRRCLGKCPSLQPRIQSLTSRKGWKHHLQCVKRLRAFFIHPNCAPQC